MIEEDEVGWQPPSDDPPTPMELPRLEDFIRIDPTTVDESFEPLTE